MLSYPGSPGGVAPMWYARTRYAMPASNTIRIATIVVRVRCAVFTTGSANALTPLLTASTPVIAVQPLEKAFNKSQALTATVGGWSGGGGITGSGSPPAASDLATPSPSVMNRV